MASATRTSSLSGRTSARVSTGQGSRFDRRLAKILEHATEVFCEKGYEGASMRDLSRASRMSLAGLYYYFDSKEKLLYLIQKYTFSTIVERLRERLQGVHDPEQRVRIFIQNHLEYFLANQKAVKVLSHEDDVLKNGYGSEIAAIKREYYRICLELVDELKRAQGLEFSSRIAVLSLFGMMNWIYTWHNPRVDADTGELAREMGDIFLYGVCRGQDKFRAAGQAGRRYQSSSDVNDL
jgi:TetR/AcrR family transcriptional regulator, cholesterol catabolism regulator